MVKLSSTREHLYSDGGVIHSKQYKYIDQVISVIEKRMNYTINSNKG